MGTTSRYEPIVRLFSERLQTKESFDITYKELIELCGLGFTIEELENDPDKKKKFCTEMTILRGTVKRKFNMVSCNAKRKGHNSLKLSESWYTVSRKTDVKKDEKQVKTEAANVHALEKDNQRLFNENAKLLEQLDNITAELCEVKIREEKLRDVISSLLVLAGLSA